MNQQELISLIWSIANKLRGPYRPPQYRKVMIPLTVLRRLDCVLEPTKDKVLTEYKELKARKLDEKTIEATLCRRLKLPFFNASRFTFAKLLGDPDKLAPNLVAYIKGFSGSTRQILERFEFEAEIEKLDKANRLFEIVKTMAAVDLHPATVPNTAMGYVFEDLVRRFNEQANEEAGDHFTPREVIWLMVHLLFSPDDDVFTEKGRILTVYDPWLGILSDPANFERAEIPDDLEIEDEEPLTAEELLFDPPALTLPPLKRDRIRPEWERFRSQAGRS